MSHRADGVGLSQWSSNFAAHYKIRRASQTQIPKPIKSDSLQGGTLASVFFVVVCFFNCATDSTVQPSLRSLGLF